MHVDEGPSRANKDWFKKENSVDVQHFQSIHFGITAKRPVNSPYSFIVKVGFLSVSKIA